MGILDRISMIARSNINDALDKATNPQVAFNQFVFEMQEGLKQAQAGVVDAVAQQKLFENQANDARTKVGEWEKRAETAVRAGRDDLAQEALRQKASFEKQAADSDEQAKSQAESSAKLKEMYSQLQTKVKQLELDKTNILARYSILKTANMIDGRDPVSGLPTSNYGRMQQKIMAEEVRAEMDADPAANAEAEIDKLGGGDPLDDELAALKTKMGMGKKAEDPPEAKEASETPSKES